MSKTAAIDSLPVETLDEVCALRMCGKSSDTIWEELEDKLQPYITTKMLANYVHGSVTGSRRQPPSDTGESLGVVAALLEQNGIDIGNIGAVEKVRVSKWQGLTKDKDGDAQIHELKGASVLVSPSWDSGPAWPVIQPPAPVTIKPTTLKRAPKTDWKQALVLPDIQAGFRRDADTFELDPFHDVTALELSLQVARRVNPDRIVLLGDVLDFAEFGRFEQEPAFALTTQATLDFAYNYIARLRATCPYATIDYLEGNHDRRLQKSIINNAKSAFGIRQGGAPENWPVLSVPHLLRLDELNVTYHGGYPANILWLNERLACIHGHKVRSSGSTAAAVIDDERVSVIFGHVHRIEMQMRTRRVFEGKRFSLAATPGCLCRIDGTVPSTKGSTDVRGRSVSSPENWQQGLAVVTYQEGDSAFDVDLRPIFDGGMMLRGELIAA